MERDCWKCALFWSCKNTKKYNSKEVCDKYINGQATIDWDITQNKHVKSCWTKEDSLINGS